LKYLIAGLGSIGRRHLENLRILDPEGEITIWHTHSPKRAGLAGGVREVFSFEDAIRQKPDIAILATPASTHIPLAQKLAGAGIDIFIEKPVSSTHEGLAELRQIQDANGILIMVGYNLRFHPPLGVLKQCLNEGKIGRLLSIRVEVGQYLPEWRPGTDYRTSVSAKTELGGGAILELSHEIDYARWLAGDVTTVMSMAERVSDLEIDGEDLAEIILRFSSGALGSIHLDMVQRSPSRSCKMVGTLGTAIWDGMSDSVQVFTTETRQWTEVNPAGKQDRNQMYLDELDHFLTCCRTRKDPTISLTDGARALEIALAVLESSRTKRSVSL